MKTVWLIRAKIYVNEEELSAAELQGISNIIPVKFTDGAYYNFPEAQKITDGVYMVKAKGHTNGTVSSLPRIMISSI